MTPSFSDLIDRWAGFYALAGGASATLAGLLFVAVSLHIDLIADESAADVRALAARTFSNFGYLVFVALMFLIPGHDPISIGSVLLVFSIIGFLREIQVLRQSQPVLGGTGRLLDASFVLRRVLVPVGCYLALMVGSVVLMSGDAKVLYWLVGAVILLLSNASGNSWSLLVQLAILKREQTSRTGSSETK